MTVALVSAAKIAEWRLRIDIMDDSPTSPMTLKAPYAAGLTEIWRGEFALAAMTRRNAQAVAAFLESLDGKVTPFKLTLAQPVMSQPGSWTASLIDNPRLGADMLNLAISPAGSTLKAGTLLTIGDIDSDPFQLFEVLTDVTTAAATEVTIAPRVRRSFSGNYDAVDVGEVQGRFVLADDFPDINVLLSHGVGVIPVMEGL